MMNMQNMMKQAQKLQKQMEKSQAELAATTFTGKSAQDLVVAELTGDKKWLTSLSLMLSWILMMWKHFKI